MRKFIFITSEGETKTPTGIDVENLQVLGFGKGIDAKSAFLNFIDENKYLDAMDFNEVIGIELMNEKQFNFSLKQQNE